MPKKITDQLVLARDYSKTVIANAPAQNQREGQYLFNSLPTEAAAVVTGTDFDPFYKHMSQYQVEDWLNKHIIFNQSGSVIGVFANNKILWERNY